MGKARGIWSHKDLSLKSPCFTTYSEPWFCHPGNQDSKVLLLEFLWEPNEITCVIISCSSDIVRGTQWVLTAQQVGVCFPFSSARKCRAWPLKEQRPGSPMVHREVIPGQGHHGHNRLLRTFGKKLRTLHTSELLGAGVAAPRPGLHIPHPLPQAGPGCPLHQRRRDTRQAQVGSSPCPWGHRCEHGSILVSSG